MLVYKIKVMEFVADFLDKDIVTNSTIGILLQKRDHHGTFQSERRTFVPPGTVFKMSIRNKDGGFIDFQKSNYHTFFILEGRLPQQEQNETIVFCKRKMTQKKFEKYFSKKEE